MHTKVHKLSNSSPFRSFKPSKFETFNLQPPNFQTAKPSSSNDLARDTILYFGTNLLTESLSCSRHSPMLVSPFKSKFCKIRGSGLLSVTQSLLIAPFLVLRLQCRPVQIECPPPPVLLLPHRVHSAVFLPHCGAGLVLDELVLGAAGTMTTMPMPTKICRLTV